MDLTLTITLSDRLFNLAERMTAALEALTQSDKSNATTVSSPKTEPTPETPVEDESDPMTPARRIAPISGKTYTAQDIREAMHRCRSRIEGEDYQESQGEQRAKWHKPLTEWFKIISGSLGYEKPSLIDDQDKIASFINSCEDTVVENGNLIEKCPF